MPIAPAGAAAFPLRRDRLFNAGIRHQFEGGGKVGVGAAAADARL